MTTAYVDGFLLAVPDANRETYRRHAEAAWPVFRELGASTMVECWGDDVPDGRLNSLNSAVMRRPGETTLFSWVTWPDRATRQAAWQTMMSNGPQGAMDDMPFDGSRMIYGGFQALFGDTGVRVGYVDGTIVPVPMDRRDDYAEAARILADVFREHGALAVVDCWSDDLPEGQLNSFHTAVLRRPDEAVVFSWINWPDKATHDAGWERVMSDPRMATHGPHTVGADMERMIHGSFTPLVDA